MGLFADGTGTHGLLRDTFGVFTTLDAPGALTTEARGINSAGQIVGGFYDSTGFHGFLATPDTAPPPVPEPSTMLLLGSGMAGLAALRRAQGRRKRQG